VIKYRLHCTKAHEFEAWFASIAAYDVQAASANITCPQCGSHEVSKSVMAPHVAVQTSTASKAASASKALAVTGRDRAPGMPVEFVHALREAHQVLATATEDVGARFPEEVRRMHYGEADERGIRGTASGEEARALADEGIEIGVLPPLPEDAN
jgi:hypothetical protein